MCEKSNCSLDFRSSYTAAAEANLKRLIWVCSPNPLIESCVTYVNLFVLKSYIFDML